MINGQITCREGHSSWWGRAWDWGGRPLQQSLQHVSGFGLFPIEENGYCPQVDDDPGAFGRLDVTGAPLLVTLSRLPERCSQSTTLSLKPWPFFCFKDREPLHCGLISGGRVMFFCLLGCCSHPWWFNQHLEKGFNHSSCLPVSWSFKTCIKLLRWEGVVSILPPWYQQLRWQCLLQKRYTLRSVFSALRNCLIFRWIGN